MCRLHYLSLFMGERLIMWFTSQSYHFNNKAYLRKELLPVGVNLDPWKSEEETY